MQQDLVKVKNELEKVNNAKDMLNFNKDLTKKTILKGAQAKTSF